MLTPAFELSQTDNYLTFFIKAPYTKVSEAEIYIDGCEFKFYSKPYYLRLNLPGNIGEESLAKADYDADTGAFTITVPKETPGERFEGLDLLTKLLAPTGAISAPTHSIEVLDDAPAGLEGQGEEEDDDEDEEDEEFDWQIEQEPYIEEDDLNLPGHCYKYGFACQKSGVFTRRQTELHEIADIEDPDNTPNAERREMRMEEERSKFDDDHYLCDLYQDDQIQPLLGYRAPWQEEYHQMKQGTRADELITFTEEEKEKLRKLPRKEYLFSDEVLPSLYLGLIDLIFAYAYNYRSTEGEGNVESGWTISKMSSTLSWMEVFSSLQDVITASYRRGLCYPLYRNWNLLLKVHQDTQQIFALGKKRILRCLLDVHRLLLDDDPRYILNELYITDYCVWIQHASDKKISSLAESLSKVSVSKEGVGLDIVELEQAALLVADDDPDLEHVTEHIASATIADSSRITPPEGAVTSTSEETGSSECDDSDSDSDSSGEYTTASDDSTKEEEEKSLLKSDNAEKNLIDNELLQDQGLECELKNLNLNAGEDKILTQCASTNNTKPLITEITDTDKSSPCQEVDKLLVNEPSELPQGTAPGRSEQETQSASSKTDNVSLNW